MKRLLKLALSIFSLFIFALCACSSDEPGNKKPKTRSDIELNATEKFISKSQNDFSIRLLKEELKNNEKTNHMISPLSCYVNLSMVANGAKGETQTELLNVLYPQAKDASELNKFNSHLFSELTKVDNTAELILANSVWTLKSFPIVPAFQDVMAGYYNAPTTILNNTSDMVKKINGWANNVTGGKIAKYINNEDEISASPFHMISAICFNAIWNMPFKTESTTQKPFYNASGSQSNVATMYKSEKLRTHEDSKIQICAVAFGNGAYKLYIILPKDRTFTQLDELISPELWKEYKDGMDWTTDVKLYLPKFQIETSLDLNKSLKAIGINSLFSFNPDLTGISESWSDLAPVMKQKSSFKIDEEGVEVVSVTSFSGLDTCPMPSNAEFRCDHPFVFLIEECSTGTIVLGGAIYNL